MMLPFESANWTASDDLRFAGLPLTVPWSKTGLVRFGSAANPGLIPISSRRLLDPFRRAVGRDVGTVLVRFHRRVTSCSVIVHTSEFASFSAMLARISSPG